MSAKPTYEAAKIVAPIAEAHFADRHFDARERGEENLAPLPDAEIIQAIVDATFWASFRREEGNFPKISIAFVRPEQVNQPLLFETSFDLLTSVLTKLAPAVERPGVHLGVWPGENGLQIWGAIRSVPSLCFVLEVVEPGLLVIKHRRIDGFGKFANVAILKGEQIKIVDENGTSLPDCPGLLKALLAFTSSDTEDPSVNVLIQLAASMRAHGHGGTLLVVPTGKDAWRQSIVHPLQYSVGPPYTALADLLHQVGEDYDENRWVAAVRKAVDTVAGLTAVDGATIVNEAYEVLGFGGKIRRPEGSAPVERIVSTEPIVGNEAIVIHPVQTGGTRHLSAAQFVNDQRDSLALVASQDGRFTIFAWSPCEEMVHSHRVDSLLL
jgi:sensor domain DACNV-containing protein